MIRITVVDVDGNQERTEHLYSKHEAVLRKCADDVGVPPLEFVFNCLDDRLSALRRIREGSGKGWRSA